MTTSSTPALVDTSGVLVAWLNVIVMDVSAVSVSSPKCPRASAFVTWGTSQISLSRLHHTTCRGSGVEDNSFSSFINANTPALHNSKWDTHLPLLPPKAMPCVSRRPCFRTHIFRPPPKVDSGGEDGSHLVCNSEYGTCHDMLMGSKIQVFRVWETVDIEVLLAEIFKMIRGGGARNVFIGAVCSRTPSRRCSSTSSDPPGRHAQARATKTANHRLNMSATQPGSRRKSTSVPKAVRRVPLITFPQSAVDNIRWFLIACDHILRDDCFQWNVFRRREDATACFCHQTKTTQCNNNTSNQ